MKKLFTIIAFLLMVAVASVTYGQPLGPGGIYGGGGSGTGDVTAASTAQTWGDGTGPVVWTFSVTGTDPTISVATGAFTVNTDLALGANDITMTGSLGATGAGKLTKGWFTDLEVTNAPTINGAAWTTILQPLDTELTALAGLTSAANAIPYFTGSGTAGTISSSANMVSLLGSADYATARTNLGLAIGTNVQAYDAELAAIAGLTFADKSMIQLTGAGAASVLTCASANQLIGVNAANDALECKSTISVTIDDSAAQFTSATASKGTLKFDQTGITDTKTVTVKYTAADSYTLTPTLTGNTAITYPTSGTLINSTPTLTGDITSTTPAVDWDLKDNDASALSFDAADKAGIINIVTTNAAEGVTMSGTLGVTGIATFAANPKIYDGDSHHLSLDVADLGGDATLLLGGTFTNTKWCSFGTATGLTCNEDAPAGSGDITAVGSCASGSCATIGNADTSGGYIDFLEDSDNGTNYVRLKAPDSTADAIVTLPGVTSTLAILGANTFTADQTITGNILPEAANTRTIGSSSAEWADLYLGDGAVIYGQNDQSATLTSGASLWTANNFSVTTQFKLPSTDADPTATAGYLRHDSSNTSASGGGLLAWHDGTNIRQVVDTGTTFTQITKYEYLPIRYAEDDVSVAAPAAAAEIGTTSLIGRSFAEDADNGVIFFWQIPSDYVSGIKYRVFYALNANGQADETAAFSLAGCSVGNSDALACSEGTAVVVSDELGTDEDTGELIVTGWSTAVTITDAAAGEMASLLLIRDVSEDDYSDHLLVSGIEIKYVSKLAPFSDY